MFLLQSSDKLWKVYYVTANRFMYNLGWTNLYYRNCGSSLRACTLRKHVYNYSDLENRMSLTSHTSTAIAMRPKIFALLYWMDWCILQAYLWKYLNIMEPFIHDKYVRQKSMPIGNSQFSKTGYESYQLHYTVTSIEEKVVTFKHDLNMGWSIYRLLIIRLQVQWINGNSCYKSC